MGRCVAGGLLRIKLNITPWSISASRLSCNIANIFRIFPTLLLGKLHYSVVCLCVRLCVCPVEGVAHTMFTGH